MYLNQPIQTSRWVNNLLNCRNKLLLLESVHKIALTAPQVVDS